MGSWTLFRKNVYILGAGFSANAGAPVMKNFVEQAKLLRDDPRRGLPNEDQKTFERVFKRLGELRVAQAIVGPFPDRPESCLGTNMEDRQVDGDCRRQCHRARRRIVRVREMVGGSGDWDPVKLGMTWPTMAADPKFLRSSIVGYSGPTQPGWNFQNGTLKVFPSLWLGGGVCTVATAPY